jgi:hypothetical protein
MYSLADFSLFFLVNFSHIEDLLIRFQFLQLVHFESVAEFEKLLFLVVLALGFDSHGCFLDLIIELL